MDLISRQAAIDALKNRWKKTRNYEGIGDDIAEECELYLKQLPSAQPEIKTDRDTISRAEAIEALARMMPRSYTPDGSHPADEDIFRAQEIYVDCIETLEILPSAQPERKTGRMSNKDWIDFLCEQFDISRTSARDMLHGMMKCKKEDNFKRIFNPMQKDGEG